MNESIINETELRKAVSMMAVPEQVFEVRILPTAKNRKPASGYFKDADTLVEAFKSFDLRRCNVYITLNPINPALFSREQSEHFVTGAASTSDNDIIGYNWLMIDLDPKRPAGISSTNEELRAAWESCQRISRFLSEEGWELPLMAHSGNGVHLLYKIQLANNEDNRKLVERCLKVLDAMFSTEAVEVDTANFNPSRICKLYGTLAQKGSNTDERPHRMSKILIEDKPLKVTDRAYLEKLAANELVDDAAPQPARYNGYKPSEFDIEHWLDTHGIRYNRPQAYKSGMRYVLEECPFNSDHKAPDSAIYTTPSGAVAFKCAHNSCSGYHWQDLRVKFEPDAYTRNNHDERIEKGWQEHNRNKLKETPKESAPMFETAEQILSTPHSEPEYVKTGINRLDLKLRGLEKGKISLITGLRGASKSTFLNQIMLNAVNDGHRVISYSGELSDRSMLKWLLLQAAGKHHTEESQQYAGFYFVPEREQHQIAKWLSSNLLIYNNNYGHDWQKLLDSLSKQIQEAKADLVVLDNLMTLDITALNQYDKYEAQTRFIQSLKVEAMTSNCHIIIVAHPRKAVGLLRLDDVSGSGNLTNYVDNAFIIHRINDDFKRLVKQTLAWKDGDQRLTEGYTNMLEVAKERENGTCDYWCGMFYEKESKRLLNYKAENKIYGWDDGNSAEPEINF